MAGSTILTLAEAAALLNLSPQRVHQLLAAGELDGPLLPPGRVRFAPGAGRVARDSLERLLAERSAQTTNRRGRRHAADGTWATSLTAGVSSQAELDRVRAAAQELKVKMDALRDQVRAERARNHKLIDVASDLLSMLRQVSDDADQLDDITDSYSQALTQLLAPHTPTT